MPDNEPFPGTPLGDGHYLVSEEELRGSTIMRPGIPDPYHQDMVEVRREPITSTTELRPVDIVLFFDKRSRYPLDNGLNQWAFVVDAERALYVRGAVHSIKLYKARKLSDAVVVRRFPPALAPYIAEMLLRYRWRPMWFKVAVNHLQGNNFVPFLEGAFYPPDPVYSSDEEYEDAWQHMVGMLEPRDPIFTFDRRSLVSKLIALTTHGPFSHCATYAGNGIISEIVTSGTRMVPIETYKGRRFRVAAYRHYGRQPNTTVEEMLAEMRAEDGRPGYSYVGALGAGLRALIGRHRDADAPNSLILSGFITFIAQA